MKKSNFLLQGLSSVLFYTVKSKFLKLPPQVRLILHPPNLNKQSPEKLQPNPEHIAFEAINSIDKNPLCCTSLSRPIDRARKIKLLYKPKIITLTSENFKWDASLFVLLRTNIRDSKCGGCSGEYIWWCLARLTGNLFDFRQSFKHLEQLNIFVISLKYLFPDNETDTFKWLSTIQVGPEYIQNHNLSSDYGTQTMEWKKWLL